MKITFILKDILEEQKDLVASKITPIALLVDMYSSAINTNLISKIEENTNCKYKKDFEFKVFYSSSLVEFCVRFEEKNDSLKVLEYLSENYKDLMFLKRILPMYKGE